MAGNTPEWRELEAWMMIDIFADEGEPLTAYARAQFFRCLRCDNPVKDDRALCDKCYDRMKDTEDDQPIS